MATVNLRDISLNQTAITGKRKTTVVVVDTTIRRKIDPTTRQRTEEIEGYNVDIIAARGRIQTVKLPTSIAETFEKIRAALAENMTVTVNFGEPSTLSGRPYAMMNNGQLFAGVSATASVLNIVSVENEVDDTEDSIEL